MTSPIEIRAITAAQARELRHAVLRPHQKPDELVYPGDDAAETLHAGAFRADELVGIATVTREAAPGEHNARAWRLRGMATTSTVRRQGVGRALIDLCVAHIRAYKGDELWCNGRTSAREFYEALGFRSVGTEFDVPVTGPHYVFRRRIE
ncbi:MAG: GNAT family N-acetyltransferase [Chloroflexi bacterium]|nr:GNAT family N-acetyltransferase [Chloroflexota bacterium]